jgi:flagellar basal-body rod modification protein FlgD
MSDTPSLLPATPPARPAAAPASRAPTERDIGAGSRESATMLNSDFDTFLKMLTAQVQNQDPLNPLDSTDFAVQLATFSGVEQQVRTNDLLAELSGALGGSDLGRLAGWVGMEARAATRVVFDGSPVALEASPSPDAARAELQVRDTTGKLWDRFDIPVATGPVTWSGQRADGSAFASGAYDMEVVSYGAEGEVIETSVPESFQRITEIRRASDGVGTEIVLAAGVTVSPEDISALRE